MDGELNDLKLRDGVRTGERSGEKDRPPETCGDPFDVPEPVCSVLDKIKDGIIIVSDANRIVYSNEMGKLILGRDNVAGLDFFELFTKPAGSKLYDHLKVAKKEKKDMRTLEYISHLCRWYTVNVYSSGAYTSMYFRDYTSEQMMDERYRLTHFSVENSQDYAFWVLMDGRISYANKTALDNLGYSRREFTLQNINRIIGALAGKDWGEFARDVVEKKYLAFESPVRKKNGGDISGDVRVNYLVYRGQEYLVIFIKDITGRKRAEEEREEARAQAELYLDLMGHDINNLNQVALGYLELIAGMTDDEKLKELVSRPLDAITSSSRLIDNVRKLKNARAGGLKTEATDLNDVLAGLQAQYANVRGRDITIHFKPEPGSFVMVNGLIRDVFSNLIGNAIKHSKEKAVRVDLMIVKSLDEGRKNYKVIVEDDGPGIPDELKGKLFSRFQKGNMQAHGRGLGLYLVRTLVEDFHGKVWVEDRVAGDYTKGSRFVVALPAAP